LARRNVGERGRVGSGMGALVAAGVALFVSYRAQRSAEAVAREARRADARERAVDRLAELIHVGGRELHSLGPHSFRTMSLSGSPPGISTGSAANALNASHAARAAPCGLSEEPRSASASISRRRLSVSFTLMTTAYFTGGAVGAARPRGTSRGACIPPDGRCRRCRRETT